MEGDMEQNNFFKIEISFVISNLNLSPYVLYPYILSSFFLNSSRFVYQLF